MSCNCCCVKTLKLCKISVCDNIKMGITALVDGVHTLKLDYLGIQLIIQADFNIGDNIEFPADGLNENFTFTSQLFDPNDTQILIEKDSVEYDCFEIQTTLTKSLNSVSIES